MALFAFNQSYVAVAVMVTALAVGQHAFYRSLNGQLVANTGYFLSFSKGSLNKSPGLLDDLVHVALSKFETIFIHYRRIVIYSMSSVHICQIVSNDPSKIPRMYAIKNKSSQNQNSSARVVDINSLNRFSLSTANRSLSDDNCEMPPTVSACDSRVFCGSLRSKFGRGVIPSLGGFVIEPAWVRLFRLFL